MKRSSIHDHLTVTNITFHPQSDRIPLPADIEKTLGIYYQIRYVFNEITQSI